MLIECYYRLYSLEEMVDAVVFVGGVDGIGAESEAHQYGFYSQNFFETRDDRYAAAAAHWDGQLAVCVEKCLFCCFVCRHFYGTAVCLTTMQCGNFYSDIIRCNALEIFFEQFAYLLMVLVWHKTA